MKQILLLVLLFSISIQAIAQDKKWSFEANYSLVTSEYGISNNDNSFEIGIKYRFVNTSLIHLGLGVTSGFNYDKLNSDANNFTNKTYIFQPKIFAEFDVPFLSKLHPSIGLGYSVVSSNLSGNSLGLDVSTLGGTYGGVSFDVGLSYDITKRFFVQVKYDYINLHVKDDYIFEGQNVNIDDMLSIGQLKFGVGFRF